MFSQIASPLAAGMYAESPFGGASLITNSTLFALIVTAAIVIFARSATRDMKMVPEGRQNLFEALLGALYELLEGIVGKHMIPKVFSLLATIFIFIVTSNWFGLLPGVGTVGFSQTPKGPLFSLTQSDPDFIPLLRPSAADMNTTLAIAAVFMVLWLWWTIREIGAGGFIMHMFAPKGGVKGALALGLLPIFLFVGLIEIVSILFRPVSLSLRLFGNIYAGETLLMTMGGLGDKLPPPLPFLLSVVLPLPFYFLEILVGLLQALVFTLLCAVYISLSTSHDDEEAHDH